MKTTRVIIGIQSALLTAMGLFFLHRIRYDMMWSSLADFYHSRVFDSPLPWVVRALWHFAPAAWWSWVTPVAIGIAVAARFRRPMHPSDVIMSSVAVLLLVAIVFNVFVAYIRPYQYMGNPYHIPPIETYTLLANIALALSSNAFAAWSIHRLRLDGKPEKENSRSAVSQHITMNIDKVKRNLAIGLIAVFLTFTAMSSLLIFYFWDSHENRGYHSGYWGVYNRMEDALQKESSGTVRKLYCNGDITVEEFAFLAFTPDREIRRVEFLEQEEIHSLSGAELQLAIRDKLQRAPLADDKGNIIQDIR